LSTLHAAIALDCAAAVERETETSNAVPRESVTLARDSWSALQRMRAEPALEPEAAFQKESGERLGVFIMNSLDLLGRFLGP
jgi:hypothetical protein